MKVTILEEAGYGPAMEGLSLSFLQPAENMPEVAMKQISKSEPHCKFMRQMHAWFRIRAPWYWWKQMATYRIGVETQSDSTMHNILKRELTQDDFERHIGHHTLDELNYFIRRGAFDVIINRLPGGYIYCRVVDFSYSALRNIIRQRRNHKMPSWKDFIEQVLDQVQYPEFLT